MSALLTVFDIRDVSRAMGTLHDFGMTVGVAVLPLAIGLEAIRNNVAAVEGKVEHTAMLMRIVFAVAGLLVYRALFDTIMWSVWVVQNSLVGLDTYMKLVSQMHAYQRGHMVSLFSTQLPTLFAWLSVFLAVLGDQVLGYIQYAILALLYFVGPISVSLSVFKPTQYLFVTWIKNVFAVACWTLVLHVIVLAMLDFNKTMTQSMALFDPLNTLRTIAVSATFIVMVVFSPYFAEKIVTGQAMGSLAVMAVGYMVTRSSALMGKLGGNIPFGISSKRGLGSQGLGVPPLPGGSGAGRGTDSVTKSEQWHQREEGRHGSEDASNPDARAPKRRGALPRGLPRSALRPPGGKPV